MTSVFILTNQMKVTDRLPANVTTTKNEHYGLAFRTCVFAGWAEHHSRFVRSVVHVTDGKAKSD